MSALYSSLPDDAERGPPPAGWLQFDAQSELKLDLEPTRMVEPKPGRLVLFPSTMWHGTVPFEEGERLSVAFDRSEEHTSELQSLMRISYAVFCLKKKKTKATLHI